MKTTIYFIRHAEPNYQNHDDMARELTIKGIEASHTLIDQFSTISIDHFYSSPYKRAIDTITPLAHNKQRQIKIINDLRERKISDKWVGDFSSIARKQWEDFTFKLPNGESLKEVQERNILALKNILEEASGKSIIVGTHGTALSTMINYYQTDFSYEAFNQYKHQFPWIVTFEFENMKLKKITI